MYAATTAKRSPNIYPSTVYIYDIVDATAGNVTITAGTRINVVFFLTSKNLVTKTALIDRNIIARRPFTKLRS